MIGAMRWTKNEAQTGKRGGGRAPALLFPALLLLATGAPAAETAPRDRPPAPVITGAADTNPESGSTADTAAAPVPAPDPAAADLFAMPSLTADIRRAFAMADAGDAAGAAALLDRNLAAHPGVAGLHAARAGVAMVEDAPEAALGHLADAAAAGLPDPAAVAADPVFASLATDPSLGPRLAAIATTPPAPPPASVPAAIAAGPTGPVATVAAANTAWNPAAERLEAAFALPAGKPGPVLPARPKTGALDILRELWKRDRAAGNTGDLYDNRDRGHSALKPQAFPQLAHVVYSPEAQAAELDYGLQDKLLFDRPTFGNSSTAVTGGVLWRSLPRLAMTQGDGTGPLRLWQNTQANALYVYPAHKDWTPDRGDLFPANTPYILVSHGSSGSDEPFLQALALTYAAFRPDTKARLVKEHLLVPTVQMIFRRSLRDVTSRESYFSGDANPAVFEGGAINPARMVSLAQSIKADAIPPEVRIAVTGEEFGIEGIDYFGEGLSEQLFDTPGAIARILALQGLGADDDRLSGRDPRPQRPPAHLPLAPAPGRPGQGPHHPLGGRHQCDDHPRLARPLPDLRRQPDRDVPRRRRGLRLERRPRLAPRRSSPGTFPRPRSAATRPAPTGPCASRPSTTPIPTAPTPTRSSCPAPTGATTSPTPLTAASPAGPECAPTGPTPRPKRSTPPGGGSSGAGRPGPSSIRCPAPPTAASSSRRSRPSPSEAPRMLRRNIRVAIALGTSYTRMDCPRRAPGESAEETA